MLTPTAYGNSSDSPRRRNFGAVLWLQFLLWSVGVVLLGYCTYQWVRATYDQRAGSAAVDRMLVDQMMNQGEPVPAPFTLHEGDLVGRLEIPRLETKAVIFEGTTNETLARGAGHYSKSAVPGEKGNVVLAGHRDSFFRSLQDIHEGDEVSLTTAQGRFRYIIDSTTVVNPDAVEVLRPTRGATLTLITCYPFRFIGNAPQRYIVRGRKVS